MKVLVISRGYMSEKNPVWGNFEAEQAWTLQRFGHEVIFISVDSRPLEKYWRRIGLTKFIDKQGMPVYNYFFPIFSSLMTKNPFIPFSVSDKLYERMMIKLYKRIEKDYGRPDVIYSHYLFNSFLAIKLKTKYHIPMVAIEHWSQINNDKLLPRVKMMGDIVYHEVDNVISVSNTTSRRLKQHFNYDSPVVFNMIDTSSFKYEEKEKPTVFKFVTLGQNTKRKGFDVLVKAFAKAIFEKQVELLFIGTGDWSNIKNMVSAYGLEDKVKVLGPIVERADLVKVMQDCSSFVLASRKETFSVVCVEAISMGLPVISTPCGGPEEYINDSNGVLVPIDDVDSLAKALEDMVLNYDKYDRKTMSEQIKLLFSPDVIGRQVERILIKAVEDNN